MKKMSKNVLFIVVGVLLAFTIDVAAEAVISSGAVSYSNTTVSAALDELFSAVDINNKIGTTDISSIGNGTITGAIDQLNNKIDFIYGYSNPDQTVKLEYPDGFNFDNTMIIGTRVSTPYGSIVDNDYSDSYRIYIVLYEEGIYVTNHENNDSYTEYVIGVMRID